MDLENYDGKPPSWDEWFMRHVYLVALKSKDKSTKIGAILIKNRRLISEGYNGICSGVDDNDPSRNERPEKYFFYEHAERNSIFSAARFGISTDESILYTNGIPCSDCARALIQSGVKEIVVHKQWGDYQEQFNHIKWIESAQRSQIMLKESQVKLRFFNGVIRVKGLLDGKIVEL